MYHEEKLKILKELAYHNYQPFAIINFFTHEQIENSQYLTTMKAMVILFYMFVSIIHV